MAMHVNEARQLMGEDPDLTLSESEVRELSTFRMTTLLSNQLNNLYSGLPCMSSRNLGLIVLGGEQGAPLPGRLPNRLQQSPVDIGRTLVQHSV